MEAMILAAGEGIRLRPLTLTVPKVLLPVAGVPLIEYTLIWLKRHNIREVGINLYHLGEKVKDFIGDGSRFGVKIAYSPEESLLGTAGGVKKMESFFTDTFVVVYGDVLANFDLGAMIKFHQDNKALATIAVLEVPNPWDVGIIDINETGRLLNFTEKPPRGSKPGNLGSGGVYVLENEFLDNIPSEGFCDFAYNIFPQIIKLGVPVYGYHLNRGDYLLDIGTPENYNRANEDVRARKAKMAFGK